MINPMDLTGKHILITGASSGIGRATAIQASKLGARISLIARNKTKLEDTLGMLEGNGHTFYSYDLMDIDGIQELVKNIVSNNGPFDGFVHSAGISAARPVKFCTPEVVHDMMSIHYYAFIELMRWVSMKHNSNTGASYVGISSVAATDGDKAQGPYAAAKGALNSIVPPFAKELSVKGIRVNAIAFGMVETGMYQDFLLSGGNEKNLLDKQYLGIIPTEYAGNAICFLLSDSSKYITGKVIDYLAGL